MQKKPTLLHVGVLHASDKLMTVSRTANILLAMLAELDVVVVFGTDVPLQTLAAIKYLVSKRDKMFGEDVKKVMAEVDPGLVFNIRTLKRKPQTSTPWIASDNSEDYPSATKAEAKPAEEVKLVPQPTVLNSNDDLQKNLRFQFLDLTADEKKTLTTWETHGTVFFRLMADDNRANYGKIWQYYKEFIGGPNLQKEANSFESTAIFYNAKKVSMSVGKEGVVDNIRNIWMVKDMSSFYPSFTKNSTSFVVAPLTLSPNPMGCDMAQSMASEQVRVHELSSFDSFVKHSSLPVFAIVNCLELSEHHQHRYKLHIEKAKTGTSMSKWIAANWKLHPKDQDSFRPATYAGGSHPEFVQIFKNMAYIDRRDFMFYCKARSVERLPLYGEFYSFSVASLLERNLIDADTLRDISMERGFPVLTLGDEEIGQKINALISQHSPGAFLSQSPLAWSFILDSA